MKQYFGTNLKMYKNISQTRDYLKRLAELMRDMDRQKTELFVLPSYTALDTAVSCTDQSLIRLGSQNMCWAQEGQFTGEISPLMLKELGIELTMAGHSERRTIFKEDDRMECRKVEMAVRQGMTALLCIGETLEQKMSGISREVLRIQLKTGLSMVGAERLEKIWIAYEPVWSIGVNGIPADPQYAGNMHQSIKECLIELFGEAGAEVPVLYGGSVNMENARQFFTTPSIDGLFVGRSAWQADAFYKLICDCCDGI